MAACGPVHETRAAVGLGTGAATLTVPGEEIEAVHDAVDRAGGTSVVRSTPPDRTRAWNRAPSAVRVLRALKDELDPGRRFCPGRFGSWLDDREARS